MVSLHADVSLRVNCEELISHLRHCTLRITFYFENGAIITLRARCVARLKFRCGAHDPFFCSGTEPKLKYYAELSGSCTQAAAVRAELAEMVQSVLVQLLKPEENKLEIPPDA